MNDCSAVAVIVHNGMQRANVSHSNKNIVILDGSKCFMICIVVVW